MQNNSLQNYCITRYVETTNYSLEADTGTEARDWEEAGVSWVNYDVMETLNTSPRLDFIPSRVTTVLEDRFRMGEPESRVTTMLDDRFRMGEPEEEESWYQVPRNLVPVNLETRSSPKTSSSPDDTSKCHYFQA